MSCWNILDINLLTVILLENIAYHLVGSPLILLMVSFAVQKPLNLIGFLLSTFVLISLP